MAGEVQLAALKTRIGNTRESVDTGSAMHEAWKAREAGRAISHPLLGLCRAAGLPAPLTEHLFSPTRKFRADYCWPTYRLILEIDGGVWQRGGGGHSHPLGILKDMARDNHAAILGYRVLRYTPEQLPQAIDDLQAIFHPLEAA